jgi:O-methyltransferase involved in polyketide biosynthesis
MFNFQFPQHSQRRPWYDNLFITRSFLEEGVESAGSKRQIVNLGSGFDTLYWRLHSEGRAPALFVDVDFDQVTAKKCGAIRRHKELQSALLEGALTALSCFRQACTAL